MMQHSQQEGAKQAVHSKTFTSLILIASLAGCAQFPELDSTIERADANAPFPKLVPVEPLLERAGEDAITPELQAGLAGRVAALRARAARLRGAVVDGATKTRMRKGVVKG